VNVPAAGVISKTNDCGVGEYPPEYNVEQPSPVVIDKTSISISNAQRIVGVTLGVGEAVGCGVNVAVILGVIVGVGVGEAFDVRVIVGVIVLVGVIVGVTEILGVCDGVLVGVFVGDGVTKVSQSTITDLDNVLIVQGDSNLIVIFFVPMVSYVFVALKQSTPEQTPSTPICDGVLSSPQSTVKLISPIPAMLFKLVVLITVTVLQSISYIKFALIWFCVDSTPTAPSNATMEPISSAVASRYNGSCIVSYFNPKKFQLDDVGVPHS
jgi:hypothetical protein